MEKTYQKESIIDLFDSLYFVDGIHLLAVSTIVVVKKNCFGCVILDSLQWLDFAFQMLVMHNMLHDLK